MRRGLRVPSQLMSFLLTLVSILSNGGKCSLTRSKLAKKLLTRERLRREAINPISPKDF